ncbi:MAG: HutD family protein [Comamonas sp.]
MTVAFFSSAQLPAMPWKNGGGTTQEVVCWPQGADLSSFAWRISIAQIASSGPFSAFPGVDRSICLLQGDGVQLTSADGRIDHALNRPLVPFAFSGDVALDCRMLGGVSRDFNVMVRRGALRASVRVAEGQAGQADAPNGLLLALRGAWSLSGAAGTATLAAGAQDGVYWADGDGAAVAATPLAPDAQLLLVELHDVTR